MRSSIVDRQLDDARAIDVVVTDDDMAVQLEDGRTIIVPTVWFPRLVEGTPAERTNYQILGLGIHWPDLDEDISIRGLLLGEKSGENPKVLKYWMQQRAKGRRVTLEDYMREKIKKKPASPNGKRQRKAG